MSFSPASTNIPRINLSVFPHTPSTDEISLIWTVSNRAGEFPICAVFNLREYAKFCELYKGERKGWPIGFPDASSSFVHEIFMYEKVRRTGQCELSATECNETVNYTQEAVFAFLPRIIEDPHARARFAEMRMLELTLSEYYAKFHEQQAVRLYAEEYYRYYVITAEDIFGARNDGTKIKFFMRFALSDAAITRLMKTPELVGSYLLIPGEKRLRHRIRNKFPMSGCDFTYQNINRIEDELLVAMVKDAIERDCALVCGQIQYMSKISDKANSRFGEILFDVLRYKNINPGDMKPNIRILYDRFCHSNRENAAGWPRGMYPEWVLNPED